MNGGERVGEMAEWAVSQIKSNQPRTEIVEKERGRERTTIATQTRDFRDDLPNNPLPPYQVKLAAL